MAGRNWLDAWSDRQRLAHEFADRTQVSVVIDEAGDGADIHTLFLGASPADAEAAAIAILGDLLDHFAERTDTGARCDTCEARHARVKAALAALSADGVKVTPISPTGDKVQ